MLFKNITIINGDFEVQKNMFVRTEGTSIKYIGKAAPEEMPGEEVYDGTNKLMMPGLYNVHCHVPMTLLRGYGDGLPLHDWLFDKIFPFEAKLTDEDIYWGTKLGAMELISSGCTSISDMYFSINHMARALDECGMKANICHGLSSFDPDCKVRELKGCKDTITLAKDAAAGVYGAANADDTNSRIKADMGLHAEYTTTESFVRQIAELAAEENMTIHVHISETKAEHAECKERHDGRTPVKYFADCGIFRNKVQAAHCVYLEDEDVEIMKAAGAVAIHNPSSNLKLGSGIAPVKSYLDRGLKVALGTDGASSNNNLNMMEEMHMAAMIARGITLDANAISAADVLRMASLEGAKAQGRELCGKIAEGWRADIVILDMDRPGMQPATDPLSNLIFSAQSSDIVMNMIDGRVVYKNGEFMNIDKDEVIFKVNESFSRILKEL